MAAGRKEEIPLTKIFEPVLPYQTGVYVTVVNIIQCIALAFLINEVRVAVSENEITWAFALRSAVVLAIILVVWHRYVSEVQYLWPISWSDTYLPFATGIFECAIVFSVNPETASLNQVLLSVLALQFLATLTYRDAYNKRMRKTTENLYKSFHSNYPQFTLALINFLKTYDRWHVKIIPFFIGIAVAFLVFINLFPNRFNEVVFAVFSLYGLIAGEVFNNFQTAMKKDKELSLYFNERREQ